MMANDKNKKTGLMIGGIALFMLALSFAVVPFYELFCRATGIGGQTQIAKTAPKKTINRTITVRFNTDVAPGLGWNFKSEKTAMDVKPGEVHDINFFARNVGAGNSIGMAVYNVQPERAGLYFNKIQCFCFDQQPLHPMQSAEFPVQFFIDPSIADDPLMQDVTSITLSYTFFSSKNPKLKEAKASFDAWQARLIDEAKK